MSGRPATASLPAVRSPIHRNSGANATIRLTLWFLGAAVGVAAFVLVARDADVPDARVSAALTLAIGWSYLASGLLAWAREEGNRLGVLMATLGLVWLAGAALGELDSALASWAGFVALNAAVAMFVHVLVAFPSGRLATGRERVLVGAAYADLVVLAPLWMAARGDAPPRDGTAGLLRPEPFASSLGGLPAAVALAVGAAV